MDEHTLRVLEFGKILQMAASFAVTVAGRQAVLEIRPLENIGDARRRLDLVSECRRLLNEGQPPGIENFDDLTPLFRRIRPADAVLEPFAIRSFLPLFYSAVNLKTLSGNTLCPGIGDIVSRLTCHPEILRSINASIDNEGKIRDEASPGLSEIRRNMKVHEQKISGILEDTLKQKDLEPHLQDHFIAERNKRFVIPVKMDSKGSVPGIVHDISNTGETVYIEPYAIHRHGNELESLRAEEKVEEFRILKRLSAVLREGLKEIEEDCRIVAEIDALQSLAVFAEQLGMSSPLLNEAGYMKIIGGRHPLLWKTLKKEGREGDIVPLDLEIGRGHTCMVITGSNTGGKTVALKTTGMLALMALSGMHTPSGSGTTIPFLDNVLADIGDEQSIEQNLSTFSAHMGRISEIVRQSGARTLVIIDELGTGTDPGQGGALSCAILRKMKELGALTIVSTHLGMLKAFAHSEPGMMNCAMEMAEVSSGSATKYRPTYRLVMGEAGASHAFEIAESLGLHADIIREAREYMKDDGVRVEALISDLKNRASELSGRMNEINRLKEEAEVLRSSVEKELDLLRASKHEVLARALSEAEEIVRRTKAEAGDMISAIKKADREEAGKIAKSLDKKHAEIVEMKKAHSPEKMRALKEVREGQRAFVRALGKNGTVHSINIKARRCKVMVDGREVMIPFSGLFEPVAEKSAAKSGGRPIAAADTFADVNVADELNVVGQRVDPALSVIERYLNDASMAGIDHVKIIHGIGTGTLSAAIREFLKDHPLVREWRRGDEDEGGEAVTMVFL